MKKYILFLLLFLNKIINITITLFFSFLLFISSYALYDSYQIIESVSIDEELISDDNPYLKVKSFNEDIIGWINIYNTSINYPILKGKDNNEYLSKNYKGDYSFSGSIFLDYRNSSLFDDDYSILYGHHLKKGGMFSDIKRYKKSSYLSSHNKGILYAEKETHDIEVVLYKKISTQSKLYDLKEKVKNIYKTKEKLLILSTCSDSYSSDRLIIICIIK